jgi:two-component system response regulator YesN
MARILIIEGNDIFRKTLKRILTARFPCIQIEEAVDGKTALPKIKIQPPNLIFMDINFPRENGLELAREIKRQHPDIYVIVLTNYDSPEYQKAASLAGVQHLISKRLSSPEDILDLIQSILSRDVLPLGER